MNMLREFATVRWVAIIVLCTALVTAVLGAATAQQSISGFDLERIQRATVFIYQALDVGDVRQAPRGDDRDVYRGGNRFEQVQVVPVAGAIAVHAG